MGIVEINGIQRLVTVGGFDGGKWLPSFELCNDSLECWENTDKSYPNLYRTLAIVLNQCFKFV